MIDPNTEPILTDYQTKVLKSISDESKTCDDIAWDIKSHKMHVGRAMKTLIREKLVEVYHTDYSNPRYYKL